MCIISSNQKFSTGATAAPAPREDIGIYRFACFSSAIFILYLLLDLLGKVCINDSEKGKLISAKSAADLFYTHAVDSVLALLLHSHLLRVRNYRFMYLSPSTPTETSEVQAGRFFVESFKGIIKASTVIKHREHIVTVHFFDMFCHILLIGDAFRKLPKAAFRNLHRVVF